MSERVCIVQVEWLQPYTDAKIKELGASGVKQLLAVPISFVSEHIETLEEIDMEYRELAIESGIKVSSCGMGMSMLADWLDAYIQQLGQRGGGAGPQCRSCTEQVLTASIPEGRQPQRGHCWVERVTLQPQRNLRIHCLSCSNGAAYQR